MNDLPTTTTPTTPAPPAIPAPPDFDSIDLAEFIRIEEGEDYHEAMDRLEHAMAFLEQVEVPTTHTFTPGLYARRVDMAAGNFLTSRVHAVRHQFVLSQGEVSILTEKDGWIRVKAPYHGVTEAGTRRLVFVHKDATWTTFHATDKATVEDVERDIFIVRNAHLIGTPFEGFGTPEFKATLPQHRRMALCQV